MWTIVQSKLIKPGINVNVIQMCKVAKLAKYDYKMYEICLSHVGLRISVAVHH